jgi:PAS domain S-box-containing protein
MSDAIDPPARLGPDPDALESTLAAIVSSSADAIFSKDPTGIITSWNPGAQRLYGWTPEEAIGRSIRLVIPPHRLGEELKILEQILAGNRVEHYETERVRKDGAIVHVSVSVSPILGRKGDVVGASVIARDITGKKREEDLEREVERRDFIARAAHELKNPLTTIAGMAHILRDKRDALDADSRDKVYSALIRQSERANRLIGDMLELARLESGQIDIDPVAVGLRGVVDVSAETAAVKDSVDIINLVDEATIVRADAFRLEEVFVNLFTNSAKYGASSITVTAEPDEAGVRVIVADDGPGIPHDLTQELFVPFTRGDTSVPGSGLGLSISRRLCEAFGGELELDPSDGGARFRITLERP